VKKEIAEKKIDENGKTIYLFEQIEEIIINEQQSLLVNRNNLAETYNNDTNEFWLNSNCLMDNFNRMLVETFTYAGVSFRHAGLQEIKKSIVGHAYIIYEELKLLDRFTQCSLMMNFEEYRDIIEYQNATMSAKFFSKEAIIRSRQKKLYKKSIEPCVITHIIENMEIVKLVYKWVNGNIFELNIFKNTDVSLLEAIQQSKNENSGLDLNKYSTPYYSKFKNYSHCAVDYYDDLYCLRMIAFKSNERTILITYNEITAEFLEFKYVYMTKNKIKNYQNHKLNLMFKILECVINV